MSFLSIEKHNLLFGETNTLSSVSFFIANLIGKESTWIYLPIDHSLFLYFDSFQFKSATGTTTVGKNANADGDNEIRQKRRTETTETYSSVLIQ